MSTNTDQTFWKRKLDAFLHDPPEKVLDLAWHKQRAAAHQQGMNLEDAAFATSADHTAAAADRLPWPTYQHLECVFDGERNHFKHPLGKAVLKINKFATADLATDKAWDARPVLDKVSTNADRDRAQFFAYWRLWRWWASDQRAPKDPRMAFLPADTRLPDHTIWAHNSLVSAFQACVVNGKCRPAFLLFSIGPVQDFIAAARRTLDLWSGSYLLSYLIATALKQIALTLGPDQIIFPNLCGQPIFDLLLKKEIWDKAFTCGDGEPLWESLGYRAGYPQRRLLTPSLPNRFLALVPAPEAERIAREAQAVVVQAFKDIAKSVWNLAEAKLDPLHSLVAQRDRFFAQADRHLEIAWQVQSWPTLPHEVLPLLDHLPKSAEHQPAAGLETILSLAAKMPKDHRDIRNFECDRFPTGTRSADGRDLGGWKDKAKLKDDARLDNPGAAWSALYALVNWQLDAVRQNRAWQAWVKADETRGLMNEKDSLTGKEEAVLNLASSQITKEHVKTLGEALNSPWLFKKGEVIGATMLIKRLWIKSWLMEQHGFQQRDFILPDTRQIADGKPFPNQDSGDDDDAPDGDNPYFAVLAFDGDQMGQWISGSHPNMPKLRELLADYTENGETKGAARYFSDLPELAGLLEKPRPLNPSFHLQFSEMLGTFSNVCARRIVEAYDGCLIYSGGDDVLALLPSGKALSCARALRAAFRGTKDLNEVKGGWRVDEERGSLSKNNDLQLFEVQQEGFIQLDARNHLSMKGEPKNFPAIVPGPATDCSVGIAIAHFKAPLQDVVRAAQAAEKRAKNQLGRSAVAVTLMKRSGGITEWGCQWESGGLPLYEAIAARLSAKDLTAKFPHRVCQLLDPYLSTRTGLSRQEDAKDADASALIRQEFAFAIARHSAPKRGTENAVALTPLLDGYLNALTERHQKSSAEGKPHKDKLPQTLLEAVTGLCTTVAFAHRTNN